MHSFPNRRLLRPARRACALAAALACGALPAFAQVTPQPPARLPMAQPAQAAGAGGPSVVSLVPSGPRRGDPVTLNFMNADIEAVARTMATITGRNVVVDPRVKGTMNLSTDQPVPPSVAYSQFIGALRMQGFTVVDAAGLDKVVPEADAKLQGGPVSVSEGGDGGVPGGSQIVTQIFRLNHESANNLVPVLRPLISPNNTINANPGTNSLVITDYADNLRRLARVIAAMDISNATDVEVIPLRHAIASDLAPLVARLVEPGSATGAPTPAAGQAADTSFRTTLMAEPRSNALVVRASNAARMNLIRSLVERLDQPPVPGSGAASGNIHVVYLKNADAVKLAATLRAAMSGASSGSTGGGASGGASGGSTLSPGTLQTSFGSSSSTGSSGTGSGSVSGFGGSGSLGGNLNQGSGNQPSTGGQIQADPSTNSLIISAPDPQYRQLRAVIDKLDGRRAQVLVESLIVEVNAEKAAEFGIQWQALLGGGTNIGAIGTNFAVGGTNIFNITTNALTGTGTVTGTPVPPATGANLGYIYQKNGRSILGFLARFLESNTDGNILSTPNLLTLDNEEARIIIGENVPFVTGSYTNTSSGSSSVNPFQTVERQDVGLTLRVRPQINENGTVKMTIYQESSAVKAGTESAANGPTTTKRAIESTVLVDDGSIVVLGGLLQDEYGGNQEKVPGVGDIPFFGNLFKSEARSRRKTNLMVFLRPVVVRDNQSAEQLSLDRYDLMRVGQQQAQPQESSLVRVNEAPVLPEQALRRAAVPPTPVPAPLMAPSTNLQTQSPGNAPRPVVSP